MGYTQSDEITLVLIDYKKLNSEAWFDYKIQKMCSIASSMATMIFNRIFQENINEWGREHLPDFDDGGTNEEVDDKLIDLFKVYSNAAYKGAMFDARVFNIPKEEVTNCVYWRQLDASRNSIQMVGQANFSHKELQGKSCSNIQDMLMEQKGINWNNLPTYQKMGSCVIRNIAICEPYGSRMLNKEVPEGHWIIDKDIPIFKGEGREYIEKLINFE